MMAEGHEVANHSWSHRCLWLCGPGATAAEIGRAHDRLADLTGVAPRHFRPPWGMVNAAMFPALRRIGERCVFWSIQPEGRRPARRRAPGRSRARPRTSGSHRGPARRRGDPGGAQRLLQALPALLEGLHARGYTLTTVADLLVSARLR